MISRKCKVALDHIQSRDRAARLDSLRYAAFPKEHGRTVGRDGESVLGDLIEDRWVGSPVDAVIEGNVRDETAGILKTVSPREDKVIRLRFGICCESEHTLKEIGQEFDLTRERIRQIEAKTLGQPIDRKQNVVNGTRQTDRTSAE